MGQRSDELPGNVDYIYIVTLKCNDVKFINEFIRSKHGLDASSLNRPCKRSRRSTFIDHVIAATVPEGVAARV